MLLLRRLIFAPLLTCRFSVSIPPRPTSVPTQSKILMPFKVGFLHDNPGARRKPKRLGRGPGSGKGKTSGRGIKGHNCRQGGGVHVRFEGGQTPITQRLPKYGRTFRKGDRQILEIVNLGVLDYYVKRGILNPQKVITIRTLLEAGIIKKSKFGVKLLCKGAERINYPLNMEVTDASGAAIQRIKQFGGSVKLIFRTPLKLRQHMYPHKFPLPLREPIPPSWRVRKLERKEKARGVQIEFRKPKWVIARDLESPAPSSSFVYPVPKVVNSGKIHKRRVKLFKTIKYNLP